MAFVLRTDAIRLILGKFTVGAQFRETREIISQATFYSKAPL